MYEVMYEVMYLKIYGLKVLYLNNTRTMKKKVLKIGNVRGGERLRISMLLLYIKNEQKS